MTQSPRTALEALLLGLVACAQGSRSPSAATAGSIAAVPSVSATVGSAAVAGNEPQVDASCEAACTYVESCTGHAETWCRPACTTDIAASPGASGQYLACVKTVSCSDVRASLRMNQGPLGRCSGEAPSRRR